MPLRLVLDADAVRDSRHVVEVPDDLNRVRDGRVVEPVLAERVDVRLLDFGSEVRELARELAQRSLARRELGSAPVLRDLCCGLGCCALCTEVVGVRLRSVVAALLGRGHGREQLTLLTR
jgi:hypothetical protein